MITKEDPVNLSYSFILLLYCISGSTTLIPGIPLASIGGYRVYVVYCKLSLHRRLCY